MTNEKPKLQPEQMVSTFAPCDTALYERVAAIVEERYGSGRYRRVAATETGDIDVLMSPPDAGVLHVIDTPRHAWLHFLLAERLSDAPPAQRITRWEALGPLQTHRFAVLPDGQQLLFAQFLAELPALVRGHFPIHHDPDPTARGFSIALEGLSICPPSLPEVSSRWVVECELSLVSWAADFPIDTGRFALCNFMGPAALGRVKEPGIEVGRTFDEVYFLFRRQLPYWLGTEIPARLARLKPLSTPRLRDILEE
jgi:hypothetical protein